MTGLSPLPPSLTCFHVTNGAEPLAYLAAAVVALWGVAHAIPTRQVVGGFEPMSIDNHRVITQEGLAEALAMWGLAVPLITVTAVGGNTRTGDTVYRVVAGILLALACFTAVTGARTRVVWFKVCPALLTTTAALLVAPSLV
jgi:hypothetical protein